MIYLAIIEAYLEMVTITTQSEENINDEKTTCIDYICIHECL